MFSIVATIVYGQSFTTAVASTSQCAAWTSFIALLTVRPYTLLRVCGSIDPVGVTVINATHIANIALALRTSTAYGPVTSNGRSWAVGPCGTPFELSANGPVNVCATGYSVRPCVGSGNWGGINGLTCSAASQFITVIFQY